MIDEYNALIKNGTWILVPKPAGVNMVRSIWLFKHKFHSNGTLSRYKVRLVANDCSQQQGIDKKYACELLEHANMVNCNPSRTPVDTDSKLGPEGVAVQDPTLYRSLAWGLQYLTFTRPDLFYAVQQICLYMHDPREPYFAALKRILRYVRVIVDFGLQLYASATTSLVGYTDADWAGCPSTRRSTSEYCVFLVQHQRTKHIEIDIHFVRDMVQTGHIRVLHVPSRYQYADIFTKGLPTALFEDFHSSLSVRLPPAQTAGAY
nr:ribonuclease H-like domain-containing protein [Tanacetum cinerariifolium]